MLSVHICSSHLAVYCSESPVLWTASCWKGFIPFKQTMSEILAWCFILFIYFCVFCLVLFLFCFFVCLFFFPLSLLLSFFILSITFNWSEAYSPACSELDFDKTREFIRQSTSLVLYCETFVHSIQWTSSDWLLVSLPLGGAAINTRS